MVLCSAFLDPLDLIRNAIIIVKRIMAKKTARTMIAVEPSDPPVHSSHLPLSTGAKFGAHVEQRKFLLALL
jgi:hypothetical protein